jgi:Putative DNA-binding domain
MIPKPINEITWSDIEALRDSGREEDDMIEYKGSFSGGSDFLAFSDSQRIKAVDGIAKEAIAFLNGRGGDIVIGVKEAANDHPKIEAITPIANVDATADRLGQALAALIEPTQSVLSVRAVRQNEDAADGVIIVRAPSSLRAPHRSTRTKECYVRRGRESVPMPMDEVQDLTLNRTMRRSERFALIDEQFDTMVTGLIGRHRLPSDRFHVRVVYVPFSSGEVLLNYSTLSAFEGKDPDLHYLKHKTRNDVVFRSLGHRWDRKLRGRVKDSFRSHSPENKIVEFNFVEKSILSNLTMKTEFAHSRDFDNQGSAPTIPAVWLIGYFANTILSFQNVLKQHSDFFPGIIRVAVYQSGSMDLRVGNDNWPDTHSLIAGLSYIPDFELSGLEDFDAIFKQLQIDLYSLAGIEPPQIWSLNPSQ